MPPTAPRKISEAISGRGSARAAGASGSQASSTMNHDGYTARIEYDDRDDIFVGRVLGIRNIISFHGETVGQLRKEFHRAVDDYLAECRQEGMQPEKPASGKLLLRVPPEVHGRAMVAAQAAGKSLNQWATEVLKEAVRVE